MEIDLSWSTHILLLSQCHAFTRVLTNIERVYPPPIIINSGIMVSWPKLFQAFSIFRSGKSRNHDGFLKFWLFLSVGKLWFIFLLFLIKLLILEKKYVGRIICILCQLKYFCSNILILIIQILREC